MISYLLGLISGIIICFIIAVLNLDLLKLCWRIMRARKRHEPLIFLIRSDNSIAVRETKRILGNRIYFKEGKLELPIKVKTEHKRIEPFRFYGAPIYLCWYGSDEAISLEEIISSPLLTFHFDKIKAQLNHHGIKINTIEELKEKANDEKIREALKKIKIKLTPLPPFNLATLIPSLSPYDIAVAMSLLRTSTIEEIRGIEKAEKMREGLDFKKILILMLVAGLVILIIMFVAPAISRLVPGLGKVVPQGQGVGG